MRYIPKWKIEDYRTYVAESKACGQEYLSLAEFVNDTIQSYSAGKLYEIELYENEED